MSGESIRIEGLDKLEKKMSRIARAHLLLPALQKGATIVWKEAATYPRRPPKSKYKRTNLFGDSFSVRSYQRQRDLYAVIKNTAARKGRPYGIYVMGPKTGSKGKRQAETMRHWPTLQSVVDKNAGEVAGLMQAKIDRILKE